jgi:hypothetical protein
MKTDCGFSEYDGSTMGPVVVIFEAVVPQIFVTF